MQLPANVAEKPVGCGIGGKFQAPDPVSRVWSGRVEFLAPGCVPNVNSVVSSYISPLNFIFLISGVLVGLDVSRCYFVKEFH